MAGVLAAAPGPTPTSLSATAAAWAASGFVYLVVLWMLREPLTREISARLRR